VATAASGITQTSFQANWNASSGATGYYLDVATTNTFDAGIILNNYNAGNVTSHSVTGLTAGTTYYYRVIAYIGSETSGHSNVITAATLTPPPPPAPVATKASNITPVSFQANWNFSSGATQYFLDVSTSSAFSSGFILNDANLGIVNNYTVNGLKARTTYYYRVRAKNAGGTSGNSSRINVATLQVSPPVPLPATNETPVAFYANWNPSPGATGYYLDVALSSQFKTFVSGFKNKNVLNVTSFQVTGLTPGKFYYYRLRAYSASGTSANSTFMTVSTPASLKIAKISSPGNPENQGASFGCYPNPFNEKVTISYSVAEKGRTTLEIMDITGRLVKSLVNEVQEAGLYQITWNPGEDNSRGWNPGIYIGRFRSGEYSKSLKLIFQKK
jgi:hypothetical protein